MPLYPGALQLIRQNLEELALGNKVRSIAIGTLTERQLGGINQARQHRANPLPVIIAEVLFIGQHVFNSRVVRDGYTIEDVIDQIESAMQASADFIPTSRAAAIQNHTRRLDRYGNYVRDMAIFECTSRHPRPELFSVMPKGDKPPKAYMSQNTKGRT
jgi:hypothetical protein